MCFLEEKVIRKQKGVNKRQGDGSVVLKQPDIYIVRELQKNKGYECILSDEINPSDL